MTLPELTAIFLLAGIEIKAIVPIENEYWPRAYVELIEKNPWYLVTTEFGVIKIGWRKRVISIEWSQTNRRGEVTHDDVTKGDDYVHAYGYGSAVTYLTNFKRLPIKEVS